MKPIAAVGYTEKAEKAEKTNRLAESYLSQGKSAEAIASCQQGIKIYPDFAPLYKTLGNGLLSRGKLAEAMRAYTRAIELQPDFAAAHANRGAVFYQQERWEEAIASYQKALALNPNLLGLYSNLAKVFREQEQLAKAAEQEFKLGNLLAQQGRRDEAINCYRQAVELKPEADAYLNLGILLRQQGQIDLAIDSYRKAIASNPSNPKAEAYFSLGNALLELEKWEEAIASYLEALTIKPDLEGAYQSLGYALGKKGRYEDAIACPLHIISFDILQEFSPQPLHWAVTAKTDPKNTIEYLDLDPASTFSLARPKTIHDRIHPQFSWQNHVYPSTFIAFVANGRAWADAYTTAVIAAENKIVEDICQGSYPLIFCSQKLPSPIELPGKVAFLSVRGGSTYFHWLSDLLGRIALLRSRGIDFGKIDFFVVSSCHLPYQRETLNILGIPESKIVQSSRSPHIRAEQLIVPSLPGTVGIMTEKTGQFLRREILPQKIWQQASAPERIYISRKSASYRRVVNEDEIISVLRKFGFVAIALENLSFREQVALLAAAKVIVSPHGAGLTNLVFCNPGAKVIEIFARVAVSANYWLLSNMVELDYYYLLGEPLENYYAATQKQRNTYSHPLYEDIFVSVDSLLATLELAGV
ncbi:MAG: DUF563 domain-containing protein [Oscillatoria sp. SIO1A7]|nr:DUF563 domain-containing protein [Oscillatoria sp. SIO1A7]